MSSKNDIICDYATEALIIAHPEWEGKPTAESIEQVMRPYADALLSRAGLNCIEQMLLERDRRDLQREVAHWLEANTCVFGSGEFARFRIQFLLSDPCTCTTKYLPKAVEHADPKKVHKGVLKLAQGYVPNEHD